MTQRQINLAAYLWRRNSDTLHIAMTLGLQESIVYAHINRIVAGDPVSTSRSGMRASVMQRGRK